jgi:gephyrin
MAAPKLKSAILIISDTASEDPSTDRAGQVLTDTFSAEGGDRWDMPVTAIVPDDITQIQRSVQRWADAADYVNLIVTTGGTGFAVQDHTPEVGGLISLAFLMLPSCFIPRLDIEYDSTYN